MIIPRKRGLFQESVLSPFIFNLFIDELASQSSHVLLYADDIVLKCRDARHARELLAICEKWASENAMSWNIK